MTNKHEIELFIKQLADDLETCRSACSKLSDIGKDAEIALPALKQALENQKDDATKTALIHAIGKISGKKEVDTNIEILTDNSLKAEFRWLAAHALGNMEDVAKKAIPDLIAVMKEEDIDNVVRCDCAYALGRIGRRIRLEKDFEEINNVFYDVLNEKVTLIPPESIGEEIFRSNIALAFMKLAESGDFFNLAKNNIALLAEKENNKTVKYYLNESLK